MSTFPKDVLTTKWRMMFFLKNVLNVRCIFEQGNSRHYRISFSAILKRVRISLVIESDFEKLTISNACRFVYILASFNKFKHITCVQNVCHCNSCLFRLFETAVFFHGTNYGAGILYEVVSHARTRYQSWNVACKEKAGTVEMHSGIHNNLSNNSIYLRYRIEICWIWRFFEVSLCLFQFLPICLFHLHQRSFKMAGSVKALFSCKDNQWL